MKLKKILAFVCAMLLCVGVFAGCNSKTQEVFSVNGEKVTQEKYAFFLETMKEMIALESELNITDENSWQTIEIDNKKAIDVAKAKAIDDVVSLMVQVQQAKKEGISITDNDKINIKNQKTSIVEQYGGQGVFNAQLKKWGVSPEIFDSIMLDYMYRSKIQAKYVNESEKINDITEEEILAKYNSMKEETTRESVFVKHILIMIDETTNEEQAKQEAQATLDRLNAGEDFDTVMRQVSDDIESSYDGYSFIHNDGKMDEDFDNAAYALLVGEVSGPVKTRFGYHIIKRLEAQNNIEPLEQVRESIVREIKNERYGTMVLDEWVSNAVVIKNEEVLGLIK